MGKYDGEQIKYRTEVGVDPARTPPEPSAQPSRPSRQPPSLTTRNWWWIAHDQDRRHRCRRHRNGVHRDRPRRGPATHRRAGPRASWAVPRNGARSAPRRSASRARTPPSTTSWRIRRVAGRPCHLPERPPRVADQGDPRGRPARRLREAAGDGRRRAPRELVALAAQSGLVNATNFNIRYYPLNQQARETVASGTPRRGPARHRPLLPGLAAARERLELAAPAGSRRRAAGGRRHRVALDGPHDVRHGPAHQPRSWRT